MSFLLSPSGSCCGCPKRKIWLTLDYEMCPHCHRAFGAYPDTRSMNWDYLNVPTEVELPFVGTVDYELLDGGSFESMGFVKLCVYVYIHSPGIDMASWSRFAQPFRFGDDPVVCEGSSLYDRQYSACAYRVHIVREDFVPIEGSTASPEYFTWSAGAIWLVEVNLNGSIDPVLSNQPFHSGCHSAAPTTANPTVFRSFNVVDPDQVFFGDEMSNQFGCDDQYENDCGYDATIATTYATTAIVHDEEP